MPKRHHFIVWTIGILAVVAIALALAPKSVQQLVTNTPVFQAIVTPFSGSGESDFGNAVKYQPSTQAINSAIAADFDTSEIGNVQAMEQAYGFTFSADELSALSKNKFVVKKLTDTSVRPAYVSDAGRELAGLYATVAGGVDYKNRTQANSLFYSTDVFFDAFNNLYTETLKEMENKTFYPAMKDLSKMFYEAASAKLAAATTDADKKEWSKLRDYFAVPYALFETAAEPLAAGDYYDANGSIIDPETVQADFATKDKAVDTYDNAAKFVDGLGLDEEHKAIVLADLQYIFKADYHYPPQVFADEYQDYAEQEGVAFEVDFTQFTPRATYTSSSLRREYFRGMKWYIMVPFFLKSSDLTTYAYGVSQLMAENPTAAKDYDKLESAINFLVGGSDDLMPADYLQSLVVAKGAADPEAEAMDYLVKAHNPKIKDLSAGYGEVGTEQSDDVLLKTKGLRFFSGKFIIDSYWTGQLTQGDEALRPGYTQKLPPYASALEVMTLLGSDYAAKMIPQMDFYDDSNKEAITKALTDLQAQNAQMTDADWQKNIYTSWLWTIKGLFEWQQTNHDKLPQFMQSDSWAAKTLMTANAWWTELRHATILYAKQSFAELGAGGDDSCDTREVPPPPKGYIEPNIAAYDRLMYMAKRMQAGLDEQGYKLNNSGPLENYITALNHVRTYVEKELGNSALVETTHDTERPDPADDTKTCVEHWLDDGSDWEFLRYQLPIEIENALPVPTEGPILTAKDRRNAIIADVHTGGDSEHSAEILYEGVGVPYVIFTAVKDVNGPRLTVGFTMSHYEFQEGYGGQRKTDEDWQTNFYTGSDPYDAYQYTDASTWPAENSWYAPLFDLTK